VEKFRKIIRNQIDRGGWMDKELEALGLAVRDYDWHRVRLALEALKASLVSTPSEGNHPQDGANISEEELGKQGYVPGPPAESKNVALEGDEAPDTVSQ
jgi:hypothetical protein